MKLTVNCLPLKHFTILMLLPLLILVACSGDDPSTPAPISDTTSDDTATLEDIAPGLPAGVTLTDFAALQQAIATRLDPQADSTSLVIWQVVAIEQDSLIAFAYHRTDSQTCLGIAALHHDPQAGTTFNNEHSACTAPTTQIIAGSWQFLTTPGQTPYTITVAEIRDPDAAVQVAIVTYTDGAEVPVAVQNNRLIATRDGRLTAHLVQFINEFGNTEASAPIAR